MLLTPGIVTADDVNTGHCYHEGVDNAEHGYDWMLLTLYMVTADVVNTGHCYHSMLLTPDIVTTGCC